MDAQQISNEYVMIRLGTTVNPWLTNASSLSFNDSSKAPRSPRNRRPNEALHLEAFLRLEGWAAMDEVHPVW